MEIILAPFVRADRAPGSRIVEHGKRITKETIAATEALLHRLFSNLKDTKMNEIDVHKALAILDR